MPRIDPHSPVPLYHQIAQLIRARIESGELAPGDTLDPLREAAAEWDVNFHTVRHAYAELARDGLVEPRGPRGTRVLGSGPATNSPRRPRTSSGATSELDGFLAGTLSRARDDFGLSPRELAQRLARESEAGRPRVRVLECSQHQCLDLSRQIESVWDVEALPWCLDREDELPLDDLVATHFHYNEVRLRWPQRLAATLFVPIAPATGVRDVIEQRLAGRGDFALTLCERDQPTADAVAADLSVVLPPGEFPLRTRVIDEAGVDFDQIEGDLLLLPPRIWGTLESKEPNDSRLVEIRYLFDPAKLSEAAGERGWARRLH